MSASAQLDNEMSTLEESAAVLPIGRAADAWARRWRNTNGEEGIPCVELGRTIRVPRRELIDRLHLAPTAGGST